MSPVPRKEIITSSKLPGALHSYDKAIQESLYPIGIDYFDTYLIPLKVCFIKNFSVYYR